MLALGVGGGGGAGGWVLFLLMGGGGGGAGGPEEVFGLDGADPGGGGGGCDAGELALFMPNALSAACCARDGSLCPFVCEGGRGGAAGAPRDELLSYRYGSYSSSSCTFVIRDCGVGGGGGATAAGGVGAVLDIGAGGGLGAL